ncbi:MULTISPECIES: Panacea domain-containing protein [Arcicella]|uniref:Type II toxin-antitoxin system antitoxin SocA domain-containing protein n=1 Tax=Arcicella lustrica TaxID=2984196 RepID=A0ABU5SEX7_9BACT|nr:type II toxin-antitoxin system antitoxin SocA domain-containing protein [Arcicella sp. DC25W]MEA5425834.1 type II toxin-antitoxin system antitoxin SocA domain-containing protein [Arcicella sp. DC25W]
MYSALVIASKFVNRAIDNGKPVTQMKLQKMLYIAHGLHLVYSGKPLINENIEAWKYGPVIPQVYNYYKNWGNQPIVEPTLIGALSNQAIVLKLDVLCDSAEQAIDLTWNITKDVDAVQLSNWTHIENSPWFKVFKNEGIENFSNAKIENDLIADYFKETFDIKVDAHDTFATA